MISDVAMASRLTAWLMDEGIWHGVRDVQSSEQVEGALSVLIDADGPLGELLEGIDTELGLELDEFLEQYGWTWEANDYDEGLIFRPLDDEEV